MSAVRNDYVHFPPRPVNRIWAWHFLSETLATGFTAAVFAVTLYRWVA